MKMTMTIQRFNLAHLKLKIPEKQFKQKDFNQKKFLFQITLLKTQGKAPRTS